MIMSNLGQFYEKLIIWSIITYFYFEFENPIAHM